jgi:cyanobactin maturation PatA/PatG family protease
LAEFTKIPGLHRLMERIKGDSRICVAVLDGPVDLDHPSLAGADLTVLPVMGGAQAVVGGPMSAHGTHVASILFGQKDSPVKGIAPKCRGIIVPIFSDKGLRVSQLDLTRGIEAAVEAGAHLINLSGGQLTDDDEADEFLQRAVKLCRDRDVLLVAAVGNDRCPCHHLPAAMPSVLAVGAMDDEGHPLEFSNWGPHYGNQGVLAPGQDVRGAAPGGGTTALTGSSFAAPIVTGAAALMLSLQIEDGRDPSPHQVREAILAGVRPCKLRIGQDPGQCLVGRLDVTAALNHLSLSIKKRESMSSDLEAEAVTASCGCNGAVQGGTPDIPEAEPALAPSADYPKFLTRPAHSAGSAPAGPRFAPRTAQRPGIAPSGPAEGIVPSQEFGLVYALGTLGYDFGTEARRDTFKQLMPPFTYDQTAVPGNPYDARQMVDYLKVNPSEAKALIWTLNLELTPIYAIEPNGPFGHYVYDVLRELLSGEVDAPASCRAGQPDSSRVRSCR